MATVSDELVERVAKALEASMADIGFVTTEYEAIIITQTIAALSTPEFAAAILDGLSDDELAKVVMPAAEEMLQDIECYDAARHPTECDIAFFNEHGACIATGVTMLDAYRAAKGE